MDMLLVLPIMIPFVTAIFCILAWDRVEVQRWLALVGMFALLITGIVLLYAISTEGIQATQMGNWVAPFGITLVSDLFSAMMILITGLMGFLVTLYSLGSIDREREHFGYYPLFCIMLMGVCGAFLTGDIFNLYVWFEVLLISSFVLLALGGEKRQLASSIQYVTINLLSSAIFLLAAGMLYAVVGTLNMADLHQQLQTVEHPGIVTALALMFLVAFGIKAAIFPLFFWLPVSYHTPPVSVSAIFSALLTKVGVYALIRVFTLLFVQDMGGIHQLMLALAAVTMITGVLGAIAQYDFRSLLSFHIVSQIGYMLMGLALFSPLALAGAIYFIFHNIIAKTNLFLVSGIVNRLQNSYNLKKLGGLYRVQPVLGLLFLIPALSLAGLPPLSGFWGKLMLIRAGIEAKEYLLVAVALFVSLWTLYSMLKIWNEAFLKERPEPVTESEPVNLWQASTLMMMIPVVTLAAISILLGIAANPVIELIQRAAEQLFDPSEYLTAVLGSRTL
jgi:multicomponent Na+:H+ antiporter subunit D